MEHQTVHLVNCNLQTFCICIFDNLDLVQKLCYFHNFADFRVYHRIFYKRIFFVIFNIIGPDKFFIFVRIFSPERKIYFRYFIRRIFYFFVQVLRFLVCFFLFFSAPACCICAGFRQERRISLVQRLRL